MAASAFWQNRVAAEEKIKRLGELKNLLERYAELETILKTLKDGVDEGGDNLFF